MDELLNVVLNNIDTSVALALILWLYDGLRKRHWQKSDEWDAERRQLINELFAWKRIAQNGHAPPAPPDDQ